jgi:NTE family protein
VEKFLLSLLIFLNLTMLSAQRVGVVLSGGGASGVAHVGVLKALEENNIPIDYIAGTSMGALVGGMYAMGYSPNEIEEILTSADFQKWVFGKQDDRYVYYFRERAENSSWIGLKFKIDSTFQTKLPTNIISPINLDFAFMERTSAVSAAANYNFDSLFVPYRAVAADIHNKKEVVFNKGDLGQAMRASTTYPFFFKPIVVDDKLLFDGGLYNNFPADVMYRDFLPDVIIGSTVASEMAPPEEDDIFSQIKNMLMERTLYNEVCETASMIIIRPQNAKISILDFSKNDEVIQNGYNSTLEWMPEIYKMVSRIQDSTSLIEKRQKFRAQLKPMIIDDIQISGLTKNQTSYVNGVLGKKKFPVDLAELRPYYFRLAFDDRIKKIYPLAVYDSSDQHFRLKLKMKLDKDLFAQFGGLFSSRPINTGFVSLRYNRISRIGMSLDANAYFGKFYGSLQVKGTFDFPLKTPFLLEGDFTTNNFDYFTSASTFFEDIKPSYLIQYDRYFSGGLSLPLGNHGRIRTGLTGARVFDDYYQTSNFSTADTADRTNFNHGSGWLTIERNTLNKKFYANSGSNFILRIKYFAGQEYNIPGSTSLVKDEFAANHDFFRARVIYDTYFNKRGRFKAGFYGEAVVSNQPFFNNYTATLMEAAIFSPVPESKTLFLPQYRTHNFVAAGLKTVTSFTSRLDLRLEGYIFQPYKEILQNEFLAAYYGKPFEKRYFMASAVLVYHTPITPIAISLNYYDRVKNPFSIIFTMGYLIFNKRAID